VQKIAAAYHAGTDVPGLVKTITTEEAATNDYNLSPSRFVAAEIDNQLRSLPGIVADLKTLDSKAAILGKEMSKVVALLEELA
jgi:type I restriction enzyme M protein